MDDSLISASYLQTITDELVRWVVSSGTSVLSYQ
jgi:hypothetical protein